jgi:hypothetical protein
MKEQFEFEYDLNGHEFVELNTLLKTVGIAYSNSEADASLDFNSYVIFSPLAFLSRFIF